MTRFKRQRFSRTKRDVAIFLIVLGVLLSAAIFFTDTLRATTLQWMTKSTSVIKPESDVEKVTRLLLESSEIHDQISRVEAEKANVAEILNDTKDCGVFKPFYDVMPGGYQGKSVLCPLLLPYLYRHGGITPKEQARIDQEFVNKIRELESNYDRLSVKLDRLYQKQARIQEQLNILQTSAFCRIHPYLCS